MDSEVLRRLAWVEANAGNYRNAIRYMNRFVKFGPDNPSAYSNLTYYYVRIGDLEAAQRQRRKSLEVFDRLGDRSPWYAIHKALTEWVLLTAKGRFAEAEPFHRQGIALFLNWGLADNFPAWLDNQQQELARNLRRQGRLMEAEVLARDALREALRRRGKFSPPGVFLTRELGAVLSAQGLYKEAEDLVRASIDIAEQIRMSPGTISLILARNILGEILVAQQDWQGALQAYERIRKDGSKLVYDRLSTMGVGLPLAMLKSGRVEESVDFLLAAHRKDEKRLGGKHYRTAEKGGLLAMAYAANGKPELALSHSREPFPFS